MWFAYDLFTNERFGPYDSEFQAWNENRDKAVTVRYVTRKRKAKK